MKRFRRRCTVDGSDPNTAIDVCPGDATILRTLANDRKGMVRPRQTSSSSLHDDHDHEKPKAIAVYGDDASSTTSISFTTIHVEL